ncbi:MAG: hypothetical protein QM664_14990 [Flavihumibacter sp.]
MKKMILAAVTFLAIAGASQAQVAVAPLQGNTHAIAANGQTGKLNKQAKKEIHKLERNEVSALSKDNFARDFPGASNVVWSHGSYFDEATFVLNGVATRAYYDYTSNLVGTTTGKTYNDLPAAAKKQINKQWLTKGYTVDGVIMFDDNEDNDTDMMLYDTPFDDADNYFVELHNSQKKVVLQSNLEGLVTFFKELH